MCVSNLFIYYTISTYLKNAITEVHCEVSINLETREQLKLHQATIELIYYMVLECKHCEEERELVTTSAGSNSNREKHSQTRTENSRSKQLPVLRHIINIYRSPM
jgi:hypothetical protein